MIYTRRLPARGVPDVELITVTVPAGAVVTIVAREVTAEGIVVVFRAGENVVNPVASGVDRPVPVPSVVVRGVLAPVPIPSVVTRVVLVTFVKFGSTVVFGVDGPV